MLGLFVEMLGFNVGRERSYWLGFVVGIIDDKYVGMFRTGHEGKLALGALNEGVLITDGFV